MKKKIKNLLAIVALILAAITSTFAQREETVMGSSGFGFTGAWGGFTYNMGQFDGKYGGYEGGMWALEFGKRFFIGQSRYSFGTQIINSNNKYSLSSNNLLLGYTHKAFMPIHPIFSLGVGNSKIRLTNDNVVTENNAFTLHPSIGAELNVTRWCHVDAQIGYRAVTNSNFVGVKDKDFSGMYGQVNLKFGYSWGRYKTRETSTSEKY